MSPKRPANPAAKWQRRLLAFFAIAFLAVGLIAEFSQGVLDAESRRFFSGTLLKVGTVLGLAWIAAPQLEYLGWDRLRGGLLVGVVIVIVLWAIRPKIGAIAGAILASSGVIVALMGWFRKAAESPRRKPTQRSNLRE